MKGEIEMVIYTVKPGDTLESIARENGTTQERLIIDNEITSPNDIVVGEALVIQYPNRTYTVKQGDTLSGIARMYGTTEKALLRNNPVLEGVPLIFPGQTIIIDYQGDDQPKRTVETNGYAYPFIDEAVLRRTLPYLTYLTVFTYGFTPSGELIVPDDQRLIDIAKSYGTAPVMQISTLTGDGVFSNELSKGLLSDELVQDKLIDAIIGNMKQKGYYALDVDFEYVHADDRERYVRFAEKLRERLSAEGYKLFIALAPKTSGDQPGLLYEGHDYRQLGNAADNVLLMTYEWGYTYGPPMAVSPLPNVRRVLDYAVTEIEPDKIFMGVPNYGYDWRLPYIRGESMAESLSNVAAVDLARRNRVEIQFDDEAQSPFFYYTGEDGASHVVWFEDARSIDSKLQLIDEYGLNGGSWWNVMKYFPQNWLVLNSLYNIANII